MTSARFNASDRFNVNKLSTCNRCGSSAVFWCRSYKTGKHYLVDVAADGSTSRNSFHVCNAQPAAQPELDSATIATRVVANQPIAMVENETVQDILHANAEQLIADNREHINAKLNSLLNLSADLPAPAVPDAVDLPSQLDFSPARIDLPASMPSARPAAVHPRPIPCDHEGACSCIAKPVMPAVQKAQKRAEQAKQMQAAVSQAAQSGSAFYRCQNEACYNHGQEFPGKLPSQTGNKPTVCQACQKVARFVRRG